MTQLDAAFVVLALTLAAALAVRRASAPAPVLLAIVGIVAGILWHLIPGLPPLIVPPERVLFVFLPPLLATAAYSLPLGAFRRDLLAIGMLAVGLVLVTMVVTALVAREAAALSWAAAFALGAIVAPPDPVAASAVAERTGLSHRLVVILEGEGLVNDAVAIVAYAVAIDAVTVGDFTWRGALLETARSVPTGVLLGWVIGRGVAAMRRRMDDVPIEVAITLFVPYLTWLIAERTGASGVLAVVVLGIMLRRHEPKTSSAAARIAAHTVWGAVRFASTALVFVLLGVLGGEVATAGFSWPLLRAGMYVTAAVIAIRLVWMHTVPHALRAIGLEEHFPVPTRGELTVLGWAGMRGVVSLALALAVPALGLVDPGDSRRTIIFLTVAVIVGTLMVQGMGLLPLVRRLGVGDPEREERDERRVRARARRAALAALERMARTDRAAADHCDALAARIRDGTLGVASVGALGSRREDERPLRAALDAQRRVVQGMRDAGHIGDGLATRLETEIDADEMAVAGETARLTDVAGG